MSRENHLFLSSTFLFYPGTVQSHQHPTANKASLLTNALTQMHPSSWIKGISLTLLFHYCFCWYQLSPQTHMHRIKKDTTESLKTQVNLALTLCEWLSVLALCRYSRCQHCPVLTYHISVSRNLFLALFKTWKHCSCCKRPEAFVCIVGGVKQRALTSPASARTPAFWSSLRGLSSNSPGPSSLPGGRQFEPENTKIGLSGQIYKY